MAGSSSISRSAGDINGRLFGFTGAKQGVAQLFQVIAPKFFALLFDETAAMTKGLS
jgi:hypothetical protein